MYNRNEIIDYGFTHKFSVDKTNRALAKDGHRPMGPREEGLYRTSNWGTTPIERLKKDASEFGAGLNTLLTMGADKAVEFVKDPIGTTNTTLENAGKYISDRGPGGIALDTLSLLGSPYGLTENDIKTRGLANTLRTLPGYAWSHPGFTTLDVVLPAMGRFKGHQLGNLLEKTNAPQAIRQFIPSSSISKVNEAINAGKGIVSATDRAMIRKLAEATNMKDVDMGQVARNLQAPTNGVWAGNEATLKATEKMRDIAREYGNSLVDLGVDAGKARTIAQAQYIMEKLNPQRNIPIAVDDIVKAISGEKKSVKGINKGTMGMLADEAGRLYDQGIITPLSHRATFMTDNRLPGLVTDVDKSMGNLADRRYGKATPEELAPTLFKAYEDTAREIYDANLGRVSIDNIAKSVGRKATPSQLLDGGLLDNEIVISPRAYVDSIRQDFHTGDFTSTRRRINTLTNTGLHKDLWNSYGDDLWVVKKSDLRPLQNMANSRMANNSLKRLNSLWKTAQLITPKYVIENRLGNWSLNFLERGFDIFGDYADAMKFDPFGKTIWEGKYNAIRPERLKADTSYYGVLGEEFQGTKATQAFKQGYGTIYQGAKELSPKKVAKGLYDTFSAPVLALESQLEGLDRYANFIGQAKRMSQKTGESVESIIKRSSKDNQLYNELMGKVNRSLGDYIGRNWAIDPKVYENLSMAFPFFKYPTQAVRTLTHQAMQRPLNFATTVTLPERIGAKKWDEEVAKYPQLEGLEGGIVDYNIPGKYGYLHLHQSDVHPLGAGAGLIASGLSDWQNINISPFFSLARIPNFLDRYGNTASSPRYYNAGGQTFIRDPRTGLPTRQLATPGFGDRVAYAGSWFGNTYVPPVIAWNRYIGPSITSALSQSGVNPNATWYPNYDTSILGQIGEGKIPSWLQPIISGKTDRPGKKYPDTALNQLGVRTLKVYPKQSASARSYQMALKKYRKNQIMKNIKED